jgi:hypothetical protein
MDEYNRLVAIANTRGIRVRPYSNLRVANAVAQARVEELARRLNENIRLGAVPLVPAPPANFPAIGITVPPPPAYTRTRGYRTQRQAIAAATAEAAARGPRGEAYPLPPSTPFAAMDPTEFTFGAEFEFLIPRHLNQAAVAAAITAAGVPCHGELYNHLTRRHWKIITDGSIQIRAGYNGFEAVSPILQGAEGFQQIEKVCDVLVSLGATVNRTCGFHVHIGITPNMNRPEFFKRLVGHYCANESHIDAIMAPSRRGTSNQYCQPISATVKDRIDRAETVPQIIAQVPSRFSKLNLQSFWRHRTVEFRHHQGTIEKTKAISWIKFCMHLISIATKPEPVEITTNLLSFLVSLKMPAEEVGYFANRFAHFHSGADSQL